MHDCQWVIILCIEVLGKEVLKFLLFLVMLFFAVLLLPLEHWGLRPVDQLPSHLEEGHWACTDVSFL